MKENWQIYKQLFSEIDYKWWTLLAVSIGLFTSVFDHNSMNVALPSIADHFFTDLPTTQWILVGYGLTIAALLLPMGRLSDLLGRKKVYLFGFVIFTIAGFVAASSGNIFQLIGAKLVQGSGAAMTQGTSMAMVLSAFGERDRGKALGLTMSVVGIGAVVGPAIGGFLVDYLGWQSVLYCTSGLGAFSIIIGAVILDSSLSGGGEHKGDDFDWLGAVLSSFALVALLLGMTAGSRIGWMSPAVMIALFSFIVTLSAFVWWELRVSSPMLDIRLFRIKLFFTGATAGWLSFLGTQPVRFLMPFYLQFVLGYSPATIGWIIVPSAFCMVLVGPLSGRLSDRYGWRIFNVGGLMVAAVGLLILCNIDINSPLALVMVGMIIQTLGSGAFWPPNNSSVLSVVDEERYGVVSAFMNLVRNSGNVIGIAVCTAIVTATMGSMGYPATLAAIEQTDDLGLLSSFTTGLRFAFGVSVGSVLIGAVLSIFRAPKKEDGLPNIDEVHGHSSTAKA